MQICLFFHLTVSSIVAGLKIAGPNKNRIAMLTIYRGVIRFDRKEKLANHFSTNDFFRWINFFLVFFIKKYEIKIAETYFSPVSDCSASSVT
jgi:hypothetical protein